VANRSERTAEESHVSLARERDDDAMRTCATDAWLSCIRLREVEQAAISFLFQILTHQPQNVRVDLIHLRHQIANIVVQ
jgi:hypothetical protein